jgi:hypothetical protein
MNAFKGSVNLEPTFLCREWNLILSVIEGLIWEACVSVKLWIACYLVRLVLKVWKQKGEEYRVHGQWGWLWLSTSRKFKIQDCHKMGLRAGPQKIMVQVKGNHIIVLTFLRAVSEYSAVECFLCIKVFMFWYPKRTHVFDLPLPCLPYTFGHCSCVLVYLPSELPFFFFSYEWCA